MGWFLKMRVGTDDLREIVSNYSLSGVGYSALLQRHTTRLEINVGHTLEGLSDTRSRRNNRLALKHQAENSLICVFGIAHVYPTSSPEQLVLASLPTPKCQLLFARCFSAGRERCKYPEIQYRPGLLASGANPLLGAG